MGHAVAPVESAGSSHVETGLSQRDDNVVVKLSKWGRIKSFFNPKGAPNPPTTKWELRGWYGFEFGNSAYFIAAQEYISIFVVNQAKIYARTSWCEDLFKASGSAWTDADWAACEETGWAEDYENKGSCVEVSGNYTTNTTCLSAGGTWNAEWKPEATMVPMLGIEMGYSATYTTAVTVSIILQLASFVLFGAIADYGNLRKSLFYFSGLMSGILVMFIFLADDPSEYQFALVCNIFVQVFLNYATVLSNAWLPLLAAGTPEAMEFEAAYHGDDELKMEKEKFENRANITAKIAGTGTACSFLGGIAFHGLSVSMILALSGIVSELDTIRILLLICGVWVCAAATFSYINLETRPGPPLPKGESYCTLGAKTLCGTLMKAKELPHFFTFIAAYFVYSDGLSTMTSAATIFASLELNMGFQEIILTVFLFSGFAIISALGSIQLQKKFNIEKKYFVMVNLTVLMCIPIYATVALTTKAEYFMIVVIFSLQYGSIQTFTRSMYSSLIPVSHESEFFALFQISDKGTAWGGPLLLTIVSTQTGSFRTAFSSLILFFAFGILILFCFDPSKACVEKRDFQNKSALSTFRLEKFKISSSFA